MKRRCNISFFLILGILLSFISITGCTGKTNHTARNNIPDDFFNQLDEAISQSENYTAAKIAVIDSLKQIEMEARNKGDIDCCWRTNSLISQHYLLLNADSSLRYAVKALRISSDVKSEPFAPQKSRIAYINSLSGAGIFITAARELENIENTDLPYSLKIDLWKAGRRLYNYLSSYVGEHNYYENLYSDKYRAYNDSLLSVLPPTDRFHQYLQAERMIHNGQNRQAIRLLGALIDELPTDTNLYGMSAYQLARAQWLNGNQAEYVRYLTQAAICDIESCANEGFALPALATWLYESGDFDPALRYINFALESASSGNARMRTGPIAEMMPIIDDAYNARLNSSRDSLIWALIATGILLFISIGLVVILIIQRRRRLDNLRKLYVSGKTLETYVGNFLDMCSSYADKLSSMERLVTRKLTAGQADELLKMARSGKFTEGHDDDFFKVFDSAFLDIVPDFIYGINNLLRPDEQIVVPQGHGLTPELRIYAFVRLGINESTRISRILHYSLSTIYTYRNRMRNKAIDRENFEANVMKIGRNF